jgi:biotin carboxyl carrier protein
VDQVRTNPVRVLVDGEAVEIEVEGLPYGGVDLTRGQLDDSTVGDVQEVRSPMPGVIVSVAVQVGQNVSKGDPLCILEAIKLQQNIGVPVSGVVQSVHVQPGQAVSAGDLLVDIISSSGSIA